MYKVEWILIMKYMLLAFRLSVESHRVNRKAKTLVRLTWENPALDLLAVLHPTNDYICHQIHQITNHHSMKKLQKCKKYKWSMVYYLPILHNCNILNWLYTHGHYKKIKSSNWDAKPYTFSFKQKAVVYFVFNAILKFHCFSYPFLSLSFSVQCQTDTFSLSLSVLNSYLHYVDKG